MQGPPALGLHTHKHHRARGEGAGRRGMGGGEMKREAMDEGRGKKWNYRAVEVKIFL